MLTGRTVTNATKQLRTTAAAISVPHQRHPTTAFLPFEGFRSRFGTKPKFPKKLRKRDEIPNVLMRFRQRKEKVQTRPLAKPMRQNKQAFQDIVFKWLLEAYPESLSRQEIAARIGTRPSTVKTAMIKPLLEEGKIFKWGSRAMPYERYMPNVKAPEYYEVTGESLPAVPDVDETEYLTKIKKSLLKSNEDYEDLAKEGEEEVELTEEEQQFGENDEDTTVSAEQESSESWSHLFVASSAGETDDDGSDSTDMVFNLEDGAEDVWSEPGLEMMNMFEEMEGKSHSSNKEDDAKKERSSNQVNGKNAAKTSRPSERRERGVAAKNGGPFRRTDRRDASKTGGGPSKQRDRGGGAKKWGPPLRQGNQGAAKTTGRSSYQKNRGAAAKTGGPSSYQKNRGAASKTGGPSEEGSR